MSFRIIPVIDLKGGRAVHAVGGRRDQYRPLRSVWQGKGSPAALVGSMKDGLGVECVYVADLDAIEGGRLDLELYERLAETGVEIWLDSGVRDVSSIRPLLETGSEGLQIVVGLESILGARELRGVVERAGLDRLIFSLDLDGGSPRIARGAEWGGLEPKELVAQVVGVGVRRLILLDLAQVGTGRGTGTETLLAEIRQEHTGLAVIIGGGIRGVADVIAARERGAAAVLVGTAIHDGRFGPRELAWIASEAGADPGTPA